MVRHSMAWQSGRAWSCRASQSMGWHGKISAPMKRNFFTLVGCLYLCIRFCTLCCQFDWCAKITRNMVFGSDLGRVLKSISRYHFPYVSFMARNFSCLWLRCSCLQSTMWKVDQRHLIYFWTINLLTNNASSKICLATQLQLGYVGIGIDTSHRQVLDPIVSRWSSVEFRSKCAKKTPWSSLPYGGHSIDISNTGWMLVTTEL